MQSLPPPQPDASHRTDRVVGQMMLGRDHAAEHRSIDVVTGEPLGGYRERCGTNGGSRP